MEFQHSFLFTTIIPHQKRPRLLQPAKTNPTTTSHAGTLVFIAESPAPGDIACCPLTELRSISLLRLLNKAEKISLHYNTGWCGFTNNDNSQPILPVFDFEVQRTANTSSHHLSQNLTATLGHSPASCPREPNHKESKPDVSRRPKEEKIPKRLFSYPRSALLSPPKQTSSVERLCCIF